MLANIYNQSLKSETRHYRNKAFFVQQEMSLAAGQNVSSCTELLLGKALKKAAVVKYVLMLPSATREQ